MFLYLFRQISIVGITAQVYIQGSLLEVYNRIFQII